MPKATALTPEQLSPSSTHAPQSVMSPRGLHKATAREKKVTEPIQLRLPPEACIAIKVEAIKRGMSHSDFMLACFTAYMKNG